MRFALAIIVLASLAACGHGLTGGYVAPPVAANSTPIVIDGGPQSLAFGSLNAPYVTVTVCMPGTSSCQTIDHVLLDTGSTGLRIVASVLPATFNLPQSNAATGNTPLWECLKFRNAYSWGSVRTADVKVANGLATSQPIQLIGDPAEPTANSDCTSTITSTGPVNLLSQNTVNELSANGILGVNAFQYDCPACTNTANIFPGAYYSCAAVGGCVNSAVALPAQVQNPLYNFQTDNNGIAIVLPAIAASGQLNTAGTLILGISTQPNNQLGSAAVVPLNTLGYFTTTYNGVQLPDSYIDSGSAYLYFNGALAPCATQTGYYCPATIQTLQATNQLSGGATGTVSFSVDNYETLSNNNPTFNALANVAGTTNGSTRSFDWGLPFFYGRTVFVGFENRSAGQNLGPFFAY